MGVQHGLGEFAAEMAMSANEFGENLSIGSYKVGQPTLLLCSPAGRISCLAAWPCADHGCLCAQMLVLIARLLIAAHKPSCAVTLSAEQCCHIQQLELMHESLESCTGIFSLYAQMPGTCSSVLLPMQLRLLQEGMQAPLLTVHDNDSSVHAGSRAARQSNHPH